MSIQTIEPRVKRPTDGDQQRQRPFYVGEPLPQRLTARDMQRVFGLKSSRFYALVKAGAFTHFEIQPQIGPRTWSGERVMRYLRGDGAGRPVFGRKRR
jgi:hypothetical protein